MGRALGVLGFAMLFLLAVAVTSGITAANEVAPSKLAYRSFPIDPNSLKPPECAGLNLRNIVITDGLIVDGTEENDLIMGTTLGASLNGKGGNDCLVGGPVAGIIDGGEGKDVCIARGTVELFLNCENQESPVAITQQ